jgi:N-succinyldiaminopimelate aminotransferase
VRRPALGSHLAGFGTTIFAEMSALAEATGAINLGQGFPDTDGPDEVLQAAVEAILAGRNQYPPGPGTLELREAVAEHQRRRYGIELDPATEVLVTTGATEALAAAIFGLTEPGDEVILFEPTYDSYAPCVAIAGCVPRFVRLDPDGSWDPAELRAAVTPRTRLVLLNSPHNPTGKVFDAAELDEVAAVCRDADLLAVTDEVYERLVFDGAHVPLATRPGMAERTLTISSAGKTFSVTGWKIGWATGPAELVAATRTAKQFLTYTSGAPFQPAVAAGLRLPDAVIDALRDDLRTRRDLLCDGLEGAGLKVFRPAGTYFATADLRSIGLDDGMAFCRSLPERCGVVAVPSQVFYAEPAAGRHLVRFAFCKRPEVIAEAVRRLAAL